VAVNPKLEGNTVQVHYALDKKGRVSNVHIEAGSGATPRDIELHAWTVKSIKRYFGDVVPCAEVKGQTEWLGEAEWSASGGVEGLGGEIRG
jgi:hypothetical protein